IVLWDVAPPGILVGGLWLQLIAARGRATAVGAFALSGAAAVLMIQLGQPQLPVLKRYSALAALVGSSYQHGSMPAQIRAGWRSVLVSPTIVEAAQLIGKYAPRGTPTAVLLPSQT